MPDMIDTNDTSLRFKGQEYEMGVEILIKQQLGSSTCFLTDCIVGLD